MGWHPMIMTHRLHTLKSLRRRAITRKRRKYLRLFQYITHTHTHASVYIFLQQPRHTLGLPQGVPNKSHCYLLALVYLHRFLTLAFVFLLLLLLPIGVCSVEQRWEYIPCLWGLGALAFQPDRYQGEFSIMCSHQPWLAGDQPLYVCTLW